MSKSTEMFKNEEKFLATEVRLYTEEHYDFHFYTQIASTVRRYRL